MAKIISAIKFDTTIDPIRLTGVLFLADPRSDSFAMSLCRRRKSYQGRRRCACTHVYQHQHGRLARGLSNCNLTVPLIP
jgi:hypothetical protein